MPLLDQQRVTYQIGRIRIGQLVPVKNNPEKMRPDRLENFRFTTHSQFAARKIAELYGGQVQQWSGHPGQYEVFTDVSEIGVTVSPYDEVVTQWYEKWSGGGCERRCDSKTEQISGNACMCPADPRVRAEQAGKNPPQACKAVTRVSLVLPDLPGVGVWRLDTHSWYAAGEMADQARVLELARTRGVFVPAVLRIEQRERKAGGQTKQYPVPVIQPLVTIRQLINGELEAGGMAAQLPPAPRPLAAISAAPQPAAGEQPVEEENGPRDDDPDDARHKLAQDIADRARTMPAEELARRGQQVKDDPLLAEEYVLTDPQDDTWESLNEYLGRVWRERAAAGKSGRVATQGAA